MRISVCIATSGRGHLLEKCLESILSQHLNAGDHVQVLVPLAEAVAIQYSEVMAVYVPKGVHFFKIKSPCASAMRNAGLKKADGEILYFLDEDCSLPHPKHLANLRAYHNKHPHVTVIGGRYIDGEHVTRFGKAYNYVCNSWQDRMESTQKPFFVGGNLSIKLNLVTRHTAWGQGTQFGGEEVHYVESLAKKNQKYILVNGLDVFHHAQHNLRSFFSRAWLHGKNKYHHSRESFQTTLGDRDILFRRKGPWAAKGLAGLYIGCVQLSYLKESTEQKLRNRPHITT